MEKRLYNPYTETQVGTIKKRCLNTGVQNLVPQPPSAAILQELNKTAVTESQGLDAVQ
jgi:hypothetical protein